MNDQVNIETVDQPSVQLEGQEQTAAAPVTQVIENKEEANAEKLPF